MSSDPAAKYSAVSELIATSILARSDKPCQKSIPTYSSILEADAHGTASGLPSIAVTPADGKLLQLLARSCSASNILEVGTLAGVSTIYLATSTESAHVTTIDINPDSARIAKENATKIGVADKIDFRVGAGLDVLKVVEKEVLEDKTLGPFDFVFLDADKPNNWNYFDIAVRCCRKGAVIVVDNVVQNGNILSDEKLAKDEYVAGALNVLQKVGRDKRVEATAIQTVSTKGHDGFIMAVVL